MSNVGRGGMGGLDVRVAGNVGSFGVSSIFSPVNSIVYYDYTLQSPTEAILEQVGRASSLSTTRASNSVATYRDGTTETYGTNTAALSDQGVLIQAAATNYVLQSSNLASAYWTTRNAATTALSATAGPVTGTFLTDVTTTGATVGDVFQATTGSYSNSVTCVPSFFFKPVDTVGRIQVGAPQGAGVYGRWDIDLSLVPTEGFWVTKDHAAVTEQFPWVTTAGGASGLHFLSLPSGTSLDFQVSSCNIFEGAYPSSPIETTTIAATRAADKSRISSAGWLLNDFIITVIFTYQADKASFPAILYSTQDATHQQFISRNTVSGPKNIYWTMKTTAGGTDSVSAAFTTAPAYGDRIKIEVKKDSTLGTFVDCVNYTTGETASGNNATHTYDTEPWETLIDVGSINSVNVVQGYYEHISQRPL